MRTNFSQIQYKSKMNSKKINKKRKKNQFYCLKKIDNHDFVIPLDKISFYQANFITILLHTAFS